MICPIILAGGLAADDNVSDGEAGWNLCREHNCALWDNEFHACAFKATSRALLRIANQMVDQSMMVNTRV